MMGATLPGERRVVLRSFEAPEPGPGEVLVETRASGLCGSDLRAIYRPREQGHGPEAYRGVIAGHEPAGRIAAVGAGVAGWSVGQRVLLYHIVGCGTCADCRDGWMISCSSDQRAAYGWQRDGAHADYILADVRTLIALPDELSYVDGALIACGFGTAYAACLRLDIRPGETLLVAGLGPVGLGAGLIARAMGARVLAAEMSESRASLARNLGLEVVAPGERAMDELREMVGAQGTDLAIDCSGSAGGRELTLAAVRRWGRVAWVGEGNVFSFEPSPLLIHPQLTLHGSWVCSVPQMVELTHRLVEWRQRPEVIVTHRFPLAEVERAYREFDQGSTGKVVLTWPE